MTLTAFLLDLYPAFATYMVLLRRVNQHSQATLAPEVFQRRVLFLPSRSQLPKGDLSICFKPLILS